jgi:hypothetical protein
MPEQVRHDDDERLSRTDYKRNIRWSDEDAIARGGRFFVRAV